MSNQISHIDRARRFFERHAPEYADNAFAVATLANEFLIVAGHQILLDAQKVHETAVAMIADIEKTSSAA